MREPNTSVPLSGSTSQITCGTAVLLLVRIKLATSPPQMRTPTQYMATTGVNRGQGDPGLLVKYYTGAESNGDAFGHCAHLGVSAYCMTVSE